MIVVFTSNSKGGILQFAVTIAHKYKDMGNDVVLFCPNEANVNDTSITVQKYERKKTYNIRNSKIVKLSNDILSFAPDMVVFTDDIITTAEVALNIYKKTKTIMTVHDVTEHPTVKISALIKRKLNLFVIKKAYSIVDKILCLSKHSVSLMKELYPNCQSKVYYMPLCAHIVTEEQVKPTEVEINDFVLFFGRIDKYKGLDRLINQYYAYNNRDNIPLVIAGNGAIESNLYNKAKESNITIVNRYISDEEMNWLFNNSKLLVLPYIEASQSGIIPIAYYFGKPVVVSDLDGLTENVINHVTGEIFYDDDELMPLVERVYDNYSTYREEAMNYCNTKLNWGKNLQCLYNDTLDRN